MTFCVADIRQSPNKFDQKTSLSGKMKNNSPLYLALIILISTTTEPKHIASKSSSTISVR